jgi:hypothetical protein
MIQLQAELERRTAVWMPLPELWGKVGEMFDVAALDNLVCRLPVRFDLTYIRTHHLPFPTHLDHFHLHLGLVVTYIVSLTTRHRH